MQCNPAPSAAKENNLRRMKRKAKAQEDEPQRDRDARLVSTLTATYDPSPVLFCLLESAYSGLSLVRCHARHMNLQINCYHIRTLPRFRRVRGLGLLLLFCFVSDRSRP